MITDSVADCLTRLRNATLASQDEVRIPHSKLKENILNILKREGYLLSVEVHADSDQPAKKEIVAGIRYKKSGKPQLQHIKKISRPGRRIYSGTPLKLSARSGLGIQIFSTSKGILTDREAMDKKVGGELIAEVW